MSHVSIIGTGNMGQAIAAVAGRGGHAVQLLGEADSATAVSGDIVVLAVPYPAVSAVIAGRGDSLAGKIVVDITNPLNFETFDSLTVPADSSATAEIAAALPESQVLKAFNTTFAATLAAGSVGSLTTTVLIAGDDARREVDAGWGRHLRWPEGDRRGRAAAGSRAREPGLPADRAGGQREGRLDRRLRRRCLTFLLPQGPETPMTVNAVRLNHAVLYVADLERSIDFYQQAFDMEVVAREPRANAAFLRLPRSGNHHDLGLFGVGAQTPRPRGSLGLYHLAWQVDTIEELEEARLTLANLDAYTGESSHGATKSIYARDPDGNEFEVMWMLPKASWGDFVNAAPVERLDLPGEVRRWAGVRTAAELVPLEAR